MSFSTPTADDDNKSGVNDDTIDCPDCEGEGHFSWSECCETAIKWGDICTRCLEHCSQPECETCEGTGEVSKQLYDEIKLEEREDILANE